MRAARATGLSAACAVLGGVVGLCSVALYQSWVFLVLAVLTCAAVMLALPRAWWSRLPFAGGFGLLVVRAMLPRGEGDYLVAATSSGYTLLGLSVVLLVTAVGTAAPRERPAPS